MCDKALLASLIAKDPYNGFGEEVFLLNLYCTDGRKQAQSRKVLAQGQPGREVRSQDRNWYPDSRPSALTKVHTASVYKMGLVLPPLLPSIGDHGGSSRTERSVQTPPLPHTCPLDNHI